MPAVLGPRSLPAWAGIGVLVASVLVAACSSNSSDKNVSGNVTTPQVPISAGAPNSDAGCSSGACLGSDGLCYGSCESGTCSSYPVAGDTCSSPSAGGIVCCAATSSAPDASAGSNSAGDGGCALANLATASERQLLHASVTTGTDAVIQGPAVMNGLNVSCNPPSGFGYDAGATPPTCNVWLSKSNCSDVATPEFIFSTTALTEPTVTFPITMFFEGFPIGSGEAVCVTVENTATAIVDGWAAQALAAGPPISTTGRVPFSVSVTAPTAVISGPVTLQQWGFGCSPTCKSSSAGCDTTNVPECNFWISTTGSSGCTTVPSSPFLTLFPLAGEAGGWNVFQGLPLAGDEALCVTAKNGATGGASGWGWNGSAATGNSVGTPAFGPTPTTGRAPFYIDVTGASDSPFTQTIFTGPAIVQSMEDGCTASCSTSSAGCTVTPECSIWVSQSNCSGAPPGSQQLEVDYPAGDEHPDSMYLFNGLALAAGESLCATVTNSAALTVAGWTSSSSSAPVCPGANAAHSVPVYATTSSTTTMVDGPATIGESGYSCSASCQSSSSGCTGLTPECEVWLGNTPCTDGATAVTAFSYQYPNGSGSWGILPTVPLEGFEIPSGQSLCMSAKDTGMAIASGWATPSSTSASAISLALDLSGTAPAAIVQGPARIRDWTTYCSASSGSTPECVVWLSTSSCSDTPTPSTTLQDTFVKGTDDFFDYSVGTEMPAVYKNFPLGANEWICAVAKGSAVFTVEGWAESL